MHYRLKGGISALKRFIAQTVPSVRYGQGASGILSAQLSSMNDPALATVNILRQRNSPTSPTTSRERGVPLTVAPTECTLETIGCPLWSFGQQIFIDFGTNTNADQIYSVTGIDHTISQGEFKSTVKLSSINSYARYTSLFQNIDNALNALEGIDDDSESQ